VRPIREIAPWVPRFVADVVNRSMELDPKARYQSPGEMLADLRLISKRLEDGQVEEPLDEIPPLVIGERQAVVMLVESDVKRQDLLRDALRQTGYRVLVTDDPARAVMWFREQHEPADAVVLDASVLGDPALSAFNRLIAGPRTRNVPVILLLGPQQKKWQVKQKFADHHVPLYFSTTTKPLLAALKRLLKTDRT
jgi:serine/threonine-protein kinase